MVDYWDELSELLQDDGIFSEIRGSNIDSIIDESLNNLKFSHLEANTFQGLKEINGDLSQGLNAFLGGNRTGKSSIINAFAFCLNAEISDLLSHGFGEGTIKATFISSGEEGTFSYNLFNKNYQFIGSEPMKNSLKRKSEEFKLLVWRHKTNIPNFFYRKNRDTTIALIETSRWKIVATFLFERKKENNQELDSLRSKVRELGQLQSMELIQEEIEAVECEIQSAKEKMGSITTEIRSSLSLRRENDKVDIDSVKDMLRSNEIKVYSLRSSQRDLKVQLREYNRLIHMAPADLLINEHLTSQIIHCPMCNERLKRRPNYCPMCGTENEVNLPANIELMALQECAFKDRDKVKSEIDTLETEISELEAENQTYHRVIEEKTISEDIIDLESNLEDFIVRIANLKTRKNALINKLESVDSNNRCNTSRLRQ